MRNAGLEGYINIMKVDLSNSKLEIKNALDALIKKKEIEAVIFLTNMLAITGLYCLKELNVKIPDDLAVVAFNRNDVFNLFYSSVTHIRQPLEIIATQAVNILVDKIENGELEVKTVAYSDPELILGESSKKIVKN